MASKMLKFMFYKGLLLDPGDKEELSGYLGVAEDMGMERLGIDDVSDHQIDELDKQSRYLQVVSHLVEGETTEKDHVTYRQIRGVKRYMQVTSVVREIRREKGAAGRCRMVSKHIGFVDRSQVANVPKRGWTLVKVYLQSNDERHLLFVGHAYIVPTIDYFLKRTKAVVYKITQKKNQINWNEMKAISDDCERFMVFPPGHIYSSNHGELRRWFNPPWYSEHIPSTPYNPLELRQAFEKHYPSSLFTAVLKRLMTDVPFGVLLSGGLDSSLVAAVASRYLAETKVARQWGSQLHTFCIGFGEKRGVEDGSPDLKAAREVADYLGTLHHEFHFTVQEGIDAIEEVIYHIETYDVTTVRASTPMFLMSRKIKSLGVKMVLSGEGSDEIFGGYLYFHKAPNKEEFHQETCRKTKALHLYDCLRANKSTSAWGVEARVPFLDKNFISMAMDMDPEWKMVRPELGRIEKWVLRNAFDDDEKPYLPKHILYRQKEQFSDGVGYSWIDGLKEHANQQVSDAMLANASYIYPENTPMTKEAYYYRTIFEKFFPKNAARSTVPGGPSVACSTAKAVEWDAAWSKNPDPSGRAALGVHAAAYEETPSASIVADSTTVTAALPHKLHGVVKEATPAAV
ncbi:hypothetical protein ACLOJK_023510 [Asimina triloba]